VHRKAVLVAFVSVFTFWACAAGSVQRKAPQSKPATYADVHAQQALGKVIVTNDGKLILYEWGRPYLNWVPDVDWMAPSAARRLETWLFKVDTTADAPTSELLFYPNAGATYWLGDLSPDESRVAILELDHDDNSVRAGVWHLRDEKFTWFAPRPDEGRFDQVAVWVSAEELLYPGKGSAQLIRANAATGAAEPCGDCTMAMVQKAKSAVIEARARSKALAAKIETPDLPKGAILVAGSANGQIAVYAKDDAEVLSLMFVQPEYPVWVLFENPRKWPRPETAPKS